MKIKTLKSIYAIVGSRNATLPILECFYIDQNYLHCTDLAIMVRVSHKFPIASDSQPIIIKGHHFLRRMEHIRAPFFIKADENYKIEFSTPTGTSIFQGDSPIDYADKLRPFGPTEADKPMFTLSAWDIHLLSVASSFTADDQLRPVMEMVVMDREHIVASDAHILYYRKTKKSHEEEVLFERQVIRLMQLAQGQEFAIYKLGKNYCAAADDMTIWWRIPDARKEEKDLFYGPGWHYPNWKSVIPQPTSKVIIPVKELIQAVHSVGYAANPASNRIIFKISGDKMTLRAKDIDFGMSASDEVGIVNPEAKEIEFGLREGFILKILKCIQDEGYYQVEMGFTENTKAFLFAGSFLCMPVMINDGFDND